MSTALPPKPRVFTQKTRICVVASEYNEEFTSGLVENCLAELESLLPAAQVELIRVPGAFDIPVAVSKAIETRNSRCVIALGLLLQGETKHADFVGASVTDSLQSMAVQHKIPVIHEVLLVADEKQAYARCIAANLNRGREAARTAARMVDIFTELEKPTSSR